MNEFYLPAAEEIERVVDHWADMTAQYFSRIRSKGVPNAEALYLTEIWVNAIIERGTPQDE